MKGRAVSLQNYPMNCEYHMQSIQYEIKERPLYPKMSLFSVDIKLVASAANITVRTRIIWPSQLIADTICRLLQTLLLV